MFLHLLLLDCELLSVAQTCENIVLLLATESLLGGTPAHSGFDTETNKKNHTSCHPCCQNTVRCQGSHFLSESQAAVRLYVPWQQCPRWCLFTCRCMVAALLLCDKRITTLKGSRVALLSWSMLLSNLFRRKNILSTHISLQQLSLQLTGPPSLICSFISFLLCS